ncbi:MAG: 30S ribosomal protein S9 [Candidatus Omnitrophota bacterium]
MATQIYGIGTGRRKESVARVIIKSGDGDISVNKRHFEEYFKRETHRLIIMKPLVLTNIQSRIKFAITANINGGGISGQAEAMRLGIARALVKMEEGLKPPLKKAGFLTRDPRMRERKKYGRKRARRRFQFTKR